MAKHFEVTLASIFTARSSSHSPKKGQLQRYATVDIVNVSKRTAEKELAPITTQPSRFALREKRGARMWGMKQSLQRLVMEGGISIQSIKATPL